MMEISRNAPQICIRLPSKAGDVHQFGRMLCDALSEIGLIPIEVEDGSGLVLQSDALLLIGHCKSGSGTHAVLDTKQLTPALPKRCAKRESRPSIRVSFGISKT